MGLLEVVSCSQRDLGFRVPSLPAVDRDHDKNRRQKGITPKEETFLRKDRELE
jgi:hypothetical protein